ncbi:hypothetical protein [Xenorhabdus budapestensis]|uniref:hypothetical protein n=1 Tax=Xenorhabdus budapestensis TaxID=290110 RepID=UPI0014752BD4|nr:hypothetical protein [Xenorhabdus budapestensis]
MQYSAPFSLLLTEQTDFVMFFIFGNGRTSPSLSWAAGARSAGAGGTEPASGALRRSGARWLWFWHGFA